MFSYSMFKTMIIAFFVMITGGLSGAAVIEIFPSATATCDEELIAVSKQLKPGDELVLHGGIYSQPCRRALQINGLPTKPITIRAAVDAQPIITRPQNTNTKQNNIEIVDSSHLILRGLHFRGGSIGVRIIRGHHITIEDCEISDTQNNAIAVNSGNADSLLIRRNHIHHTGLYPDGETEGEGMYIGCHDASCRVTNSLFEGNYIHHLRGTSVGGSDGIEIKAGSSRNVIRDNVIHDTNLARQYPCIFVYGGGPGVNIVEGNVVWNCGEGIQVVADAIVRNNIVLNSSIAGISVGPHAANPLTRNISIINNTVVGHPTCIRLHGGTASNLILANNAIYCPERVAVDASKFNGGFARFRTNFYEGLIKGVKFRRGQLIAGGNLSANFSSPSDLDFWPRPKSALVGAADLMLAPALDFNNRSRGTNATDVGAYDTKKMARNPGWKIIPGFKRTSSAARDELNHRPGMTRE